MSCRSRWPRAISIYAFNMGNNNIIPFKDFQKAANALMERNMPEILHNKQKQSVFLPETHLPKIPRCVDEKEYKAKKAKLDEPDLKKKAQRTHR